MYSLAGKLGQYLLIVYGCPQRLYAAVILRGFFENVDSSFHAETEPDLRSRFYN